MSETTLAITDIRYRHGFSFSEAQIELLMKYEELLREWNRKLNLVSRRDEEHLTEAHILHSLSILETVNIRAGARMLDLGTGGGLPGIPLAIARPDLDLVLLDSIAKKIRAVESIVRTLGLINTKPWCARAEELKSNSEFAGSFDVIVTRGVTELTDLIRWSRPLARWSGQPAQDDSVKNARLGKTSIDEPYLLCLKGGDLEGEIAKAKTKTGTSHVEVRDLVIAGGLPSTLQGKKLVIIPLARQ